MDSNSSINQKYNHLNFQERIMLQTYKREGFNISAIARKLNRHKSTISREISRNAVIQRNSNLTERLEYYGDTAQLLYIKRRKNTGAKIKMFQCNDFINYIESKIITDKWSPDAAGGRYKLEHPNDQFVSTKTLYNYIDKGLIGVKSIDLLLKTKLRTKKRRNRINKKKMGDSIELRPLCINERLEEGHWEIDTVIGEKGRKSVLLTLTERRSRMEIIMKIPDKTNLSVQNALLKIRENFNDKFNVLFKSITCDNGSEFYFDTGFKEKLGSALFYTHPYSSFERGTNENHNGIIRRFIPKGKAIDALTDDAISRISYWINNLPRKILGYRTPLEVFNDYVKSIA